MRHSQAESNEPVAVRCEKMGMTARTDGEKLADLPCSLPIEWIVTLKSC